MSLIYVPSGKAREYSPLAMNIFNGCDHGCTYCYVPKATFRLDANTKPILRKNILHNLKLELKKSVPKEQILLSFLCDPYPMHDTKTALTREVLKILLQYGCHVAVLTKGGNRCLRDLDIFKKFSPGYFKIGATLTFLDELKSKKTEPLAAIGQERIDTLKVLYESGIKTFVSIEPVIDPAESLLCIEKSLPFTDQYKVGKLNHDKKNEDSISWNKFLLSAVTKIRNAGKELYVKEDLRKFSNGFELTKNESDYDFLTLKGNVRLSPVSSNPNLFDTM
jgi:DNA repair photolyase